MWNKIREFFAPPVFPDDEGKTRIARNTNATSLVLIALIMLYEFTSLSRIAESILLLDYTIVVLGITIIGIWFALKRGAVTFAASALVAVFWLATNGTAAIADGLRSTAFIANLPSILLAGFLLGWRASLTYSIASILAGFGLAYLETIGRIVPQVYPPYAQATDMTMSLFLTGVLTYFIITDLTRAMHRINTNTRLLQDNLSELQTTQMDLVTKTTTLEKRAGLLAAANIITQTINNSREIEILLPVVAHAISERFGFYHAGIYLIDDKFENAYMQAASSDGGKKMLARQYQIPLADDGILQRAISKRAHQIAQDIQPESASLEHPDLPFTRSQVVFPLIARERVIGALDIHSTESEAFQENELETLQIVADQFALALDNARLLNDMQAIIEQNQQANEIRAQVSWQELTRRKSPVYQYTPLAVQKIGIVPERRDEAGSLTVPIVLRGKNIGKIHLKRKSAGNTWMQQEQSMIHEIAAQVALALENARLLEEAQARASRERSLSEIAARISSASDVEVILRTTVQEIGKLLGDSEIAVQLNPESEEA